MSEAAEDAIIEADEPVNDATADDQATEQEDTEAEARAMGWKPLDGFKGDATKFVDAAEYVRRGKEIMPFLRKELAASNAKIAKLEKAIDHSIKHISRAEQRAYEQAKRDLEAELDQATEAQDAKAVREITQDIVKLEKQVTAEAPAEAGDEPPEFAAWKEDNPWFGKDKALTAACAALGDEALAEGFTGKALVKEVDRRLREEFPAKFAKPENPARRQAAAVEGGGSAPRRTGKTYADLPQDAKQMCDELCKDIPTMTREKYVKGYFE